MKLWCRDSCNTLVEWLKKRYRNVLVTRADDVAAQVARPRGGAIALKRAELEEIKERLDSSAASSTRGLGQRVPEPYPVDFDKVMDILKSSRNLDDATIARIRNEAGAGRFLSQ